MEIFIGWRFLGGLLSAEARFFKRIIFCRTKFFTEDGITVGGIFSPGEFFFTFQEKFFWG